MPVTADKPAPYTAAQVISSLIDRHRNRGLPAPVDADVLARASVPESLIPRTLQALVSLDLIDEEKRPTPMFEAIRLAPEPEYKAKLVEWLNSAYADVLQYVDPATDSPTAIRDAFRNYTPIGQQDRMVTLFTGLFRSAGIGAAPEAPKVKSKIARAVGRGEVRATVGGQGRSIKPTPPQRQNPPVRTDTGTLPPAITGLLASLPATGATWSQSERDRFLATFGAVLDFCFPPSVGPASTGPQVDEGDDYDVP
jgi:hypothetical protein